MKIGILGAGNVGSTLGRRWLEKGHSVFFGVRNPHSGKGRALHLEVGPTGNVVTLAEAASAADLLVLTVPWTAVAATATAAGDVSGKVLIDCTNPIRAGLQHDAEPGGSGAQRVASLFSGARVVKAFNTVGVEVMENPTFGNQKASMLVAGDDMDAKGTVRKLAADLGFDAVDVGPLSMAADLEHFALLWIRMAMLHGHGRNFAFHLMRR